MVASTRRSNPTAGSAPADGDETQNENEGDNASLPLEGWCCPASLGRLAPFQCGSLEHSHSLCGHCHAFPSQRRASAKSPGLQSESFTHILEEVFSLTPDSILEQALCLNIRVKWSLIRIDLVSYEQCKWLNGNSTEKHLHQIDSCHVTAWLRDHLV